MRARLQKWRDWWATPAIAEKQFLWSRISLRSWRTSLTSSFSWKQAVSPAAQLRCQGLLHQGFPCKERRGELSRHHSRHSRQGHSPGVAIERRDQCDAVFFAARRRDFQLCL